MSEEIKNNDLQQENNVRPDYTEELTVMLRSRRSIADLRDEMEAYHDSDLADLLEQLPPTDRRRLYRILGLDRTGDVFAYLENAAEYLEELDAEMAADVLEVMDADDAVDVLEDLDEEKRQELLDPTYLQILFRSDTAPYSCCRQSRPPPAPGSLFP